MLDRDEVKRIFNNISRLYYCTCIDDDQLDTLMIANKYHMLACYDFIGLLYILKSDIERYEELLDRKLLNVHEVDYSNSILIIGNKSEAGRYSIPLLSSMPIRINNEFIIAAYHWRIVDLYKQYEETYYEDLELDYIEEIVNDE